MISPSFRLVFSITPSPLALFTLRQCVVCLFHVRWFFPSWEGCKWMVLLWVESWGDGGRLGFLVTVASGLRRLQHMLTEGLLSGWTIGGFPGSGLPGTDPGHPGIHEEALSSTHMGSPGGSSHALTFIFYNETSRTMTVTYKYPALKVPLGGGVGGGSKQSPWLWFCYWPGFVSSLINGNWSEARQEIQARFYWGPHRSGEQNKEQFSLLTALVEVP